MKPIYFISLYLTFVWGINLNSKIVNKGTLKAQTYTAAYFGDEYTNKKRGNNIYQQDLFLQNTLKIKEGLESVTSQNNFTNLNYSKQISSKTADDIDSYIRIGYESPDGIHRQLLLGFMPNSPCDLNFNNGYDALMADARPDELFFEMTNDTISKYVIQGVGAYDNSYELPIGLTMSQSGTHKIMIDGVQNFTESIYLKDKITNSIYNLTAGNFIVNLPVGDYYNRYVIVFKPAQLVTQNTLDVDNFKLNFLKCYFNYNGNLILNNTNSILISEVFIYNLNGEKLSQININNYKTENNIPFFYKKGLYFIKIISEKGIKNIKILH